MSSLGVRSLFSSRAFGHRGVLVVPLPLLAGGAEARQDPIVFGGALEDVAPPGVNCPKEGCQ